MKKVKILLACLLLATSSWAATIGPQSVKETFNGTTSNGWKVSDGGTITSVADGVLNVKMAKQTNDKYRADLQYETSGTYTFDKTKDIVWAVKLTAALPGTSNSRKFEINYKNATGTDIWINGILGPSGDINCNDGGKIYYFNLGASGLNRLGEVQEGTVTINKIHFIFADAVIENEEDAHYSVDWVATFASVEDLQAFQDWTDEQTDPTLPYYEVCYRPKADGSNWDGNTPRIGFKDVEFEGNYQARFFSVEYFLVENLSAEKIYTLSLTTTGSNYPLSVWDFPYQVHSKTSVSDMNNYATEIVGFAPGSGSDEGKKEPITSALCQNNVWSFKIPATALTPIATIDGKTLVGLFLTSKNLTTSSSAKYATCAHPEKAHPSFTQTDVAPIINTTKQQVEESLATAVANADANDIITINKDVTISGNRLEIKKALTIQGATGQEKIICGVPEGTLMVLANGTEEDYTVTFKNLIVDGQNTNRSTQIFDTNNNAKMCFDGVSVINTTYSVVTGDVKGSGNNIILKGNNSFPTGIHLNKNKRVENQNATHTEPIQLILANDYEETNSIVLTCNDPSLFTAKDASGHYWKLHSEKVGDKYELKGTKAPWEYELTVSDAEMATLVLGFDAALPAGVKAYQLNNDGTAVIEATAVSAITKNEPVLVVAPAGVYTFAASEIEALDEQANPQSGCMIGSYKDIYVPACTEGVYNYILAVDDEGVGFYQVADGSCTIGKNRAYLSCAYDSQAGNRAPMRISFIEQSQTALEQSKVEGAFEKVMINDQILIRREGRLYRVDGQEINK